MDRDKAEQLVTRLLDDPALRAEFERSPRQAARASGVPLSEQDLEELSEEPVGPLDWDDAELVTRMSKLLPPCGGIS